MFNCLNLIERNYDRRRRANLKLEDNEVVIYHNAKEFNSTELKKLLSDLAFIKNVYKRACKRIKIIIPEFQPMDKMVYILMETIIYTLMFTCDYEVDFVMQSCNYNINSVGVKNTILYRLAEGKMEKLLFKKKFLNEVGNNHFRKVLNDPTDLTAPSLLVTDIKTFLYRYHAKENFDKDLAMVIGELVDNSFDHAKAGCLVDIDITNATYGYINDVSDKKYYAVNVCILNFGEKCIYEDISDKILNKHYQNSERYDSVRSAFGYHKNHFSKKYNQNAFFTLASFQEDISGRKDEIASGGKGLPELIRNLEGYAAENYCYVLSGQTGLFFEKEYLFYTSDGWIGFNKSNNFMTDVPNSDIMFKSTTFLTGTGYNFMLVFEGE